MCARAVVRRLILIGSLLLLLSTLVPSAGASMPTELWFNWSLTMPNHGGGAVATSERWTVIGGPQWGPPVGEPGDSFDLRDYVYVVPEPAGVPAETLVASDTEPGDRFGYDVAASGDRIAVGAPDANDSRGAVYVFTLAEVPWTETRIDPVAADGSGFGTAIGLDGTRLVVATTAGGVAVYDLHDGAWERSDLPDVPAENVLGADPAIAVDSDTVVVGRPGVADEGVVDVYTNTAAGWTVERLIASDLAEVDGYSGFGASVDVEHDCVIAGAPNTFVGGGYMGGAYVFCREQEGWSETKLNAPEQTDDDGFGTSVALLGTYYADVGAPKHDAFGYYNAGTVFGFIRSGDSWTRSFTDYPPPISEREELGFGTAVDMARGAHLVIGASGPSEPAASGFVQSSLGPFHGSFWDDDGTMFSFEIEQLATAGITKGCNPPVNDMFCPNDSLTRGQMAAFLVRALDLADDGGGNSFIDDDGSIFENDIAKLAAAGITKGCNPPVNDMFCPNDNVTRGQMAAFLVRALGYTDDGGGDLFVDDDDSIFEADIDKLATAGVTRGCNPPTNDRFCPGRNVTRGQMAAFLYRALG